MFVLKSLSKLLGNSQQKELFLLEEGSFWTSETKKNVINRIRVFENSKVTLRRGNSPFEFELVVEENLANNTSRAKEKKNNKLPVIFAFTALLGFEKRYEEEDDDDGDENSSCVFIWNDTTSTGKRVEFVCSKILNETTLEMFHLMVAQCIWENTKRRPFAEAADSEIQALVIVHERVSNPIIANTLVGLKEQQQQQQQKHQQLVVFESDAALFYVFDASTNTFIPKIEDPVRALIVQVHPNEKVVKKREFHFVIYPASAILNGTTEVVPLHRQVIDPDATLHTDRKNFSFIWCHFTEQAVTWTFSLRFTDAAAVMNLSNAMGQAIYELLNDTKMMEKDSPDKEYLLGAFTNSHLENQELEYYENDSEMEALDSTDDSDDDSDDNSDYSDDDENDDSEYRNQPLQHSTTTNSKSFQKSSNLKTNQQLAVGYKHDRSFVVRDDSIRIFKHTMDDELELLTDIETVKSVDGKRTITPGKMMLHEEDRSLLFLDPNQNNIIHKMDVEYGKIVEEWKIQDDQTRGTSAILSDSKYAQLTANQTLIGLNANSIFRIDPRLAGNKRVDSEMKQYVVKNDFSCGATTGAGELAVGSAKGEIRLFDKLDKRAKTLLPGFGDAILAIDVTESGKYMIATCKTYLLLICTELPGTDSLGFTKSMGSNKPIPQRLQLRPEHVAYLGTAVSFTPARFSTGQSEERSIITSTGPYVITWNLRRVRQGKAYDYQIRRYEDKVVADNFRYGQDRSIVVTLPHHVTMISKKSLSTPSPNILRGDKSKTRTRKSNNNNTNLPISIEDLDLDD